MRRNMLANDEYYHVCGRANLGQEIYKSEKDFVRFLFNILHFQFEERFHNISRQVDHYQEYGVFNVDVNQLLNEADRPVAVVNFCVMPNHYHFTLCNLAEGGISQYMQRVLNGYGKYFNTKYEQSGHVFAGPYNLIHVGTNEQLLYLSGYIHKNPSRLSACGDYKTYRWSSVSDYLQHNRWGDRLNTSVIKDQFRDNGSYQQFLSSCPAKDPKDSI